MDQRMLVVVLVVDWWLGETSEMKLEIFSVFFKLTQDWGNCLKENMNL